MNNKKARDIFKDQGWTYNEIKEPFYHAYSYEKDDKTIIFDIEEHNVEFYSKHYEVCSWLELEELKLINMQCKELGWLE